ncbi:MAG TPA: NfeD family protein [Polyangiales bacterium]|nr:NfeD family protein [Polyangiales bacterium]
MPWWSWFVGGLVLLLFELVTPGGFYFIFFGVAGISVGVLAALGVGPDWLLVLIFSVLSVGSLLLFRGPLLRRLGASRGQEPKHAVDSLVGAVVVLMEDLPANGIGKGELRGTGWSVQNAAGEALAIGRRCVVLRVEGLKLVVRPE